MMCVDHRAYIRRPRTYVYTTRTRQIRFVHTYHCWLRCTVLACLWSKTNTIYTLQNRITDDDNTRVVHRQDIRPTRANCSSYGTMDERELLIIENLHTRKVKDQFIECL